MRTTESDLPFDTSLLLEKYNPDFAFCYGSGVLPQQGYSAKDKPLIDFVFGVSSPLDWHRGNIKKHPEDYAWLPRNLGARFVSWLQETGPGVIFNTYVPFGDREIKYGVVSLDRLKDDLETWSSLCLAGRLHKPVKTLKTSAEIEEARGKNLEHAVNTSFILLPERFSERELYETIAGISYLGDVRNSLGGENRNKVQNIVTKNMHGFHEIYFERAKQKNGVIFDIDHFKQDKSPERLVVLCDSLPASLGERVRIPQDANSLKVKEALENGIVSIVHESSNTLMLKGIISVGLVGSIKYALAKLKKGRSK